jgi:hypothetical protein
MINIFPGPSSVTFGLKWRSWGFEFLFGVHLELMAEKIDHLVAALATEK